MDDADIQGLLRFGHGHLTEACFYVLRVVDPRAARAWLLQAPVTTAVKTKPLPATALQIALTATGLRTLGVAETTLADFSDEFLTGMAGEESRSRRLGDVSANGPASWTWGRPTDPPHLVVLLYAAPGRLAAWTAEVKGALWSTAFGEQACLPTSDMKGREPFGFVDGISQPTLDWEGRRHAKSDAEPNYGNLLSLGEFLLGYPNEYGRYTDRPLIDPAVDPRAHQLPVAEDAPGRRDLGRNGSYLVLRQLAQDVPGFWQFVDRQASAHALTRHALAEAMIGRGIDGGPLVPLSSRPIAGIETDQVKLNQFTYLGDPAATRCPFGAHIRRANPRTADLPDGAINLIARLIRVFGFARRSIRDDMVAASRFHRILRRGREYGSALAPEEALHATGQQEERGLIFICLAASISRQFEFVQNAWLADSKFDGLSGESDPLLGNREPILDDSPTDGFSLPRAGGAPRRLGGLPRFVTLRGGGYFFLPGIRALRYIAGA
jgi:Dyp-type peroxidase family